MKRLLFILLAIGIGQWTIGDGVWAQDTTKVSWQDNDSVVMAPLQVQGVGVDNYDDLTRTQSSLDLQNPENVQTTVEYDPVMGYYVVHTRIGDVDIATPYMMTAAEYQAYSERQQMGQYWQQKISEVEHDNEKKFDITDMKFNIGPADKVFGPGGVQLKMQGSAELLFGFKHQYMDNPALTQRARNNNIFDFDEKIQVNVNGKVGDKLNFNMGYNTEASFSFDQTNIKLNYKGQEDDIIQSLEAGNVSMNLNSSLISGSSALFGVKTDMKFGKLRVQALLSQQNSESQSVSSKGGAQTTNFEVSADSYDENRHFFLGYYFRDHYEESMSQLPYVVGGVTINRIEVWVTNKRGNYDQARNIVALADLGEGDGQHVLNDAWNTTGAGVPHNKANSLYKTLVDDGQVRDIQQVSTVMQSLPNMELGEDYEKVESARLLNSGEYSLNAALGYISLKTALAQDEVLAVAYEFTYGGQVYQVGEFSTDGAESMKAPNALMLKMLKSTNNAPNKKGKGTWDLMMKNVYSLGANQLSSEKFELYVQYRNDSVGTEMQYLMEGAIKGKQLLRVMNLDRLDSRNNSAPDGRFDYVEGYTVLSSSGRVIFPVLEPFGSHLAKAIGDAKLTEKYVFQELYDSTLVSAQELSEKNKFMLVGKYKGSSGNEIRLNAMNIPRGSMVVTAGGATLVENVDYTVDYTMGTVTILNQSIIDSGTNVDVKLESQSMFSMQRKSLFGAHLEYEFNKDLTMGGTIMHLREKPLTTKVNTGSEPLANTIWGVNGSWKTDLQWLSLLIDKVPWIDASAPSSFQINAEFAHLIPGHTKDVGNVGTAYIDDFEATKTNIDIHYPNYWRLASTPTGDKFSEAVLGNNVEYNKNRALLAWYTVDPIFGYPQSNTPKHIKDNVDLMSDHRTRIVYEQEVYPNKDVMPNSDSKLAVMNLSYYPSERGQYNISADEIGSDGKLTNPTGRWGGIMRKLDNTDFEKSNVEYIEFWLMDPNLTNADGFKGGDLYIDLGDISEDILRDGKKSFEHGLPLNDDATMVDYTVWGRSARTTSTVVAFANEAGAREKQDVGLDGLNSEQELLYEFEGKQPYADYVKALHGKVDAAVLAMWEADAYSPLNDPAGDDYHYYRGSDYDEAEMPVLERYKRYNGTEGNSPEMEGSAAYGTASTLQPDIEDINQDNTLSDSERFYRYHISIRPDDMQRVGQQHIASMCTTMVKLRNGNMEEVVWYQFKIPLRGDSAMMQKVGNIRNFKSIRFARIYMTNFAEETHLRLATLDLVRGEWRSYTKGLYQDLSSNQYNVANPYTSSGSMDVLAVNIEENSNRLPVNYVLPPGISRQTDPGQAQLIAQNEQAMVFRLHNLGAKDARAVYKNVSYDMRQYKRLQMFVHAECLPQFEEFEDKELTCFIRLGSDLKNNYYEYEIPLVLTPEGLYSNENVNDRRIVWPEQNEFDFDLQTLVKAKTDRNRAKRTGNSNVGNSVPYETYDPDNLNNKITVMGNPSLEQVQTIMIGVRNKSNHEVSGEVWVNELRLSQFNEQGGVAAMANAALSVSDIAQLNVAGRLETAGYGSIESNVLDRNMEDAYQLSVSAALEAGRLFPEKAKIQIPLYVSYSNETISPDYDPLDSDVKLAESIENFETKAEKDSVRQMSNTVHESTNFSVSNMKVDLHSKKRNMFYDPANFSLSASYSEQEQHSPEIETDRTLDYKGSFNYSYNFNAKPWEPFKNMEKLKKVKLLSEFNIYYLPQSWAFNTNMHRTFSHLKMREFETGLATGPMDINDLTFSKDFIWDRNFDFKYDLTKNMKFSFQTAMNATVDEGNFAPEIRRDFAFTNDYYEAWKDTIQRSLARFGDPYTYQQLFSASWNVPFNRVPYLEALTANASYNATYNWNRTVQTNGSMDNLGNVISSTRAWQVDGGINFETLYGKSKYWKQMTQHYNQRSSRKRAFREKKYTETVSLKANEAKEIVHRLNSDALKLTATDAEGKTLKLKFDATSNTKATVKSKEDLQDVKLTFVTVDKNKRSGGQVVADMFAYLGTSIRKVQVTYRNTNSITLPGFRPQAGFMGQEIGDLCAPGYDFAFGFFGDDFVEKAKKNGWLSADTSVVQPATRSMTNDLDVKLTLEPLPGLKIQVNGKRYEAQTSSIIYSYDQLQENMTGSFNITQVAIGTAFNKIGTAEDNFATDAFTQFLAYRGKVTGRVEEQYRDLKYPNAGFIPAELRGKSYKAQYGKVADNTADVLIPAFIAAYAGRDVETISLNPFMSILQVLPNWSVTFDGLGKLPWLRDQFKSISLTHAYTCKYAVGSYSTYSTWVPAGDLHNKQVGFVRDVTTDNPIPSSAYDISSVTLTENFSPLIGVNMTMKNSLSAKVEYRKQRNISLNINSVQITEGYTDEFVIGGGYTIKDLSFVSKTKGGGQKKVSNDLKINVDVSYKDIKTLLRKVEDNLTQASSGNKVLGIKVSADYVLSQKINLQLYYDHQGTTPLISSSYPVKADNFGINIKLMLTR